MKFRLFGDLETISTIGKGIMNVSLFPPTLVASVQQQKSSDVSCSELNSGQMNKFTDKSSHWTVIYFYISKWFHSIFFILHMWSEEKQVKGAVEG